MFSVIIAAHNSEKYVEETIQSLINQSFEDWECLIVENGSTDSTPKIIERYRLLDERFRIISLDVANKSAALNEGIIQSSRDWISILDSDDLWTRDKLRSQLNFIRENNIDILGTQMKYIDAQGKEKPGAPELPLDHESIVKKFNQNENCIANSSAVYKKKLHKKFGYYDTDVFVEDYDWWKRCTRRGAIFSNLKDCCFLHRVHEGSNFNTQNKQKVMKQFVDMCDKYFQSLTGAQNEAHR